MGQLPVFQSGCTIRTPASNVCMTTLPTFGVCGLFHLDLCGGWVVVPHWASVVLINALVFHRVNWGDGPVSGRQREPQQQRRDGHRLACDGPARCGRAGSSRSRRAPSPAHGSTHSTSSTEGRGPRPSAGPGLGELLVPSSRAPRLAVLRGVSRGVPRLWAVLPRAQRTRPVSPPAPAVGGQLGAGCRRRAGREPSPRHRWSGLRVSSRRSTAATARAAALAAWPSRGLQA